MNSRMNESHCCADIVKNINFVVSLHGVDVNKTPVTSPSAKAHGLQNMIQSVNNVKLFCETFVTMDTKDIHDVLLEKMEKVLKAQMPKLPDVYLKFPWERQFLQASIRRVFDSVNSRQYLTDVKPEKFDFQFKGNVDETGQLNMHVTTNIYLGSVGNLNVENCYNLAANGSTININARTTEESVLEENTKL